ncbi:MAG: hypothetical protein HY314_02105 [Acidobacteria bacterium]|nr:hypothetical protein [Acidobacteriota bacterium]
MDQTMESERAELEALLDLIHQEVTEPPARHEELMAEPHHLAQDTRRLLADI